MNKDLFNAILEFNLDGSFSEYDFSTRLASENQWTKNFTQKAILEYKKFMYLAATANSMVSPSEIVDIVWHQHLIFTKSYNEFCQLLGKQIQHIPSTHNRAEFEQFRQAKLNTQKLYSAAFGEQPSDIWEGLSMYDGLNLQKSKFKIEQVVLFAILGFAILIMPSYYLLLPLLKQIPNPHFLIGYIFFVLIVFGLLEIANRNYFSKIINNIPKNTFLFDLHPLELVYLKQKKLSGVINGVVNQLIISNQISVGTKHELSVEKEAKLQVEQTKEMQQVLDTAMILGTSHYPNILKELVGKSIFQNIAKSMNAFRVYFNHSRPFITLFAVNLSVFILVFLFGFTRLLSGYFADKPVGFITLTLIIFIILIIISLNRLTQLCFTQIIPNLYKKEIKNVKTNEWEWEYFLLETDVFTPLFIPITNYIDRHNTSTDGSYGNACSTSSGSSCSSCGSGCGGCGS